MKATRLFWVILALACSVHSFAQPVAIPATVDVSAIGAATYSIPIEVVPGTNGVQPKLSIVYNSMSGLGLLGQKWDLQGISSISRIPKSFFYDRDILPIRYDTNDRFALNGNRMILFRGHTYQENDAVYCFEVEDFSRIQKLGLDDDVSFLQTLPDGSIIEYGRTIRERLMVNDDKCLSWMVSKVSDANGNYMTYSYQQQDGEIWIDRIDYTFLADNSPAYARVVFEYSASTTPNDSYIGGQRVRQSKRLKSIIVLYNGVQVRKYLFSYLTTLQNERLTYITLLGPSNETLSVTTVEWEAPPSSLVTTDSVNALQGNYYIVAGNFDDDRIYDVLAVGKNTHMPCLIKGNADGTFSQPTFLNFMFPFTDFATTMKNMVACDINGDGIDEVVFLYKYLLEKEYRYLSINDQGTVVSSTLMPFVNGPMVLGDFDADGAVEPVILSSHGDSIYFCNLIGSAQTRIRLNQSYRRCLTGDFDGDGKTDLFLLADLTCDIYSYNLQSFRWERIGFSLTPNLNQYSVTGDFNGDGMTDFLTLANGETRWKLTLRHGTGATDYSVQPVYWLNGTHESPSSLEPKYIPIVCDINGDGKSDIIQPVADDSVKYIISKGSYNNAFQYSDTGYFSYTSEQKFEGGRFAMGDFDGNGIVDLLFSNPNNLIHQSGSVKYFNQGSSSGYFVKNITDAATKQTKFEYSRISLMPYRYFGTGMHWMPLPLVKNLIVSNGVGAFDTTSFYYGEAQYDAGKNQFIGFSQFGMKNKNRIVETFFSRVPGPNQTSFTMLIPDSIVSFVTLETTNVGNPYHSVKSHLVQPDDDYLVSKTGNSNSSIYRTNVSGTVSFLPYVTVSTQYDYLKNTKTETQTILNNSLWRPAQLITTQGYILGSDDLPSRQHVTIKYDALTLSNGVSVIKPIKKETQHFNNTSNSNPRLDTVASSYSSSGLLVSERHSDNSGLSTTTTYTYNICGMPTLIATTPNGASTRSISLIYDPTSRFVTKQTDHANNEIVKTYDGATGLCLTEQDINGLQTRYSYDVLGRQTQVNFPDAAVRTFSYTNASGGLSNTVCYTEEEETGKPTARVYFDCLGRKVHTNVSGQGYMDYVYDNRGHLSRQTIVPFWSTAVADSNKKWETFEYDAFGRIVKDSSNYLKNTYSYRADNTNYRYNETVRNKANAESTKYFDAAGRVAEVNDDGGIVTYAYDRTVLNAMVCDRMAITTGGHTTTVVTDSRGNRIQLVDPDAGTTTGSYNAWGELLTQTDGKGDVTTMSYDNQGRVVSKSYSLGGNSDTYTYTYGSTAPSKGKLVRVDRNSTLYQLYSYDNLGRLSSAVKYIEGTPYTHQYTYNNRGQLYTVQYPSGFVLRHEYDAYGRLKSLKDNATNLPVYTVDLRNSLNQPTRCWLGSDMGVQYSYDNWGLTTQIKYGYKVQSGPFIGNPNSDSGDDELRDIPIGGGDTLAPVVDPTYVVGDQFSVLQYQYNDKGFITLKNETKTNQQEAFSYDLLGRLTSYTVNGTLTYTFSYEGNGNISTNSKLGIYNYVYDSDKPHAITEVIDGAGVLPSSQCDVTYNSRNRPATISENGWSLELSYDDGLQREKSVLSHGDTVKNTTFFISKDCEREINPAFSRYIDYIYADGRIVALHVYNTTANADSLYFVQTDLLGSWDRIVNSGRSVVQNSHFDPWGNRMSASDWTASQNGSTLQFRRGFTGHEHYDRFGIINMNARLYDPVLGRFFSPDPRIVDPYSSQGLNRYSYCGNNPVMYTDPDGEFSILLAMAIGAVVGGGINLGIHIAQGDVGNFWQGLGYFTQGALAGAFAGAICYGGVTLLASAATPIGLKASIMTAVSTDLATTIGSIYQDPKNTLKILLGRFYFDEHFLEGLSQACSRFTSEFLQTWLGYNYTQLRNAFGDVDRVDYLGGATYATDELNGQHSMWGVTLGNYIVISDFGEIGNSFLDHAIENQTYLHEYGHTLQSQMLGISYLFIVGIPSLVSAANSKPLKGNLEGKKNHDFFYTETWANRLASWYFYKYYGIVLDENTLPLHGNH